MKPTIAQLRQLVGNPNAYALQKANGTYVPVREPVTNKVLKDHLEEKITIGTYLVKGEEARTLVLDVDSDNDAEDQAKRLFAALDDLGVPPRGIGIEFSGKKGYHVWVTIATYVPATTLRRLGRAACAVAGVDCEIYPKQNRVSDLGNLVKLPGSIHRATGNRNDFIGYIPQPISKGVLANIEKQLPPDEVRRSGTRPSLKCMDLIQEGVEEGGRNHCLFHLSTMLRRGGLAGEYVDVVVRQVNQNFTPPLPDAEVDALLASSERSGPICATLPKHIQCEDCPVRAPKGLFTRPGQVQHGSEGELVVVKLGKKHDGLFDVEHPDGTGYLKVAPPHRS